MNEFAFSIKNKEYKISTNIDFLNNINELHQSIQIITFNPEMLIHSQNNNNFYNITKQSILIPDGIGIIYLAKILKYKNNIYRIAGIDIADYLLSQYNNIAIIGAKQNILEQAIINIKNKYNHINICYQHNGYFDEIEDNNILDNIINTNAEIVLWAMPYARAEILSIKIKELSIVKNKKIISIGIGGSLDIWSNNIKRAPLIFQRMGMEWLWRLCLQPSRYSRIIFMLWNFILLLPLAKLNKK